ncbi:glycosyltransferase family 4 protein [Enterovirga rhinocerotis]|uniref:Glycosyltransferase involved in cell wall biosynthesis n=1 Tax=Enterovirga rhinocerotis TaxID=1339210 RepID=A0A4R7CB51_9HYPH|nr:glycosyltransferase family 4 protein [Enterovirga rhinocerotis]TDR93977.1 glycosyltransferase involved in cell wall biosynthesis [Enterovirga rhinocerotis]
MVSGPGRVAVVVKGYPRLSETFVAQELLGLERRGIPLEIWSLRQPTDRVLHPMHKAIRAPVRYLPEYLYEAPFRVLKGLLAAVRRPGFGRLLRVFAADLRRDPTPNRLRRLGQAAVLARELDPAIGHLYVHFLHTPGSVTRYAAILTGLPWSFSAHAKDIWTTPDWEKREKMAEAEWGVTCTRHALAHLQTLAPEPERVSLLYHGLDLDRFPAPPESRPTRDGSDPADPIRILAVGRAVEKKGFDDLIAALAVLPPDLHWTLAHCGGGPLLDTLKAKAKAAGIGPRIAFMGTRAQPDIVNLMREADIFALPSREAEDGDRDGLPNVLMEAASQDLAILSTRLPGILEFVRPDAEAELVPPGDWEPLSNALNLLIRDPARREALGRAAGRRLRAEFSAAGGLDRLAVRFGGAGSEGAEEDTGARRADAAGG